MRRFLAPIVLLTLLFPSFAYGDGLICKVTGWNCPEVVDIQDLVERDGRYYQKFTKVPFTGKTSGRRQGLMNDGKWNGPYVSYHDNGQLRSKGTYKDGKQEGPWVFYFSDGSRSNRLTGTFKNGKKISD